MKFRTCVCLPIMRWLVQIYICTAGVCIHQLWAERLCPEGHRLTRWLWIWPSHPQGWVGQVSPHYIWRGQSQSEPTNPHYTTLAQFYKNIQNIFERKPARIVYWGLAHSDAFNVLWIRDTLRTLKVSFIQRCWKQFSNQEIKSEDRFSEVLYSEVSLVWRRFYTQVWGRTKYPFR